MGSDLSDNRKRLARLNVALLAAFGIIFLVAAYWTVVRGPAILARSDNPRLVEAELKIRRGAILGVNSRPLAITSRSDDGLQREYPSPAAAPVLGYYSLRYGTAGIEEAYDAYLRGESEDTWGEFWRLEILGEAQTGRDLRLTIDSRWQEKAASLLGERTGAVVLFSLPDMAIRSMASSPGYDPNSLDSDFERLMADQEAPLLNRATQGQYQPGLLLQPFLLAVAAEEGMIDLEATAEAADEVVLVDGQALACQKTDAEAEMNWAEILNAKCPGPMLGLGRELGEEGLLAALAAFGLTDQPGLLGGAQEMDDRPALEDAGMAAIGQDVLAISPVQIAVALAALANDGELRQPQLVAASQDDQGRWAAIGPAEPSGRVVAAQIAGAVLASFDEREGVLEREVTVLSGPAGELNGWYLGLGPAAEARYGIVVVIEDEQGGSEAAVIGRSMLKSVLDPG